MLFVSCLLYKIKTGFATEIEMSRVKIAENGVQNDTWDRIPMTKSLEIISPFSTFYQANNTLSNRWCNRTDLILAYKHHLTVSINVCI